MRVTFHNNELQRLYKNLHGLKRFHHLQPIPASKISHRLMQIRRDIHAIEACCGASLRTYEPKAIKLNWKPETKKTEIRKLGWCAALIAFVRKPFIRVKKG